MGNGIQRFVFNSLVALFLAKMMYLGILLAVDGYMNLQLANTEEFIEGVNQGSLGECLTR